MFMRVLTMPSSGDKLGTDWEQSGNKVGTVLYDEIVHLFILTTCSPAPSPNTFPVVAYALRWN